MLFTLPSGSVRGWHLPDAVDPLHLVRVPRDVAPLVTVAPHEVDPASVAMSVDGVERIWRAAIQLYRHGVYPALTLYVRRHGQVVSAKKTPCR